VLCTVEVVSHLSDVELYNRARFLTTMAWLPPNAEAAPNLKFIQFVSAGVNHVAQHPIYTDSKIPLLSANGIHGPQIAEWVILMDLVHGHKFLELYELQKQKQWNQKAGMDVRDNPGKTVGILGYGSIGRQGESSFLLSSLFMRVLLSYTPFCPRICRHRFEMIQRWGRAFVSKQLSWIDEVLISFHYGLRERFTRTLHLGK
jgi:phosphoglycerate dehydrogenase-like enzyme